MKTIFKPTILITIFVSLQSLSSAAPQGAIPKPELKKLESRIKNAETYRAEHLSKIDSLKDGLLKKNIPVKEQALILMKLSNEFMSTSSDSALHYSLEALGKAKDLEDLNTVFATSLNYVEALGNAGFFSHAKHRYDSLLSQLHRDKEIDRNARIEFFKVGRKIYTNMYHYSEGSGTLEEYYRHRYNMCNDELYVLLPPSSPFYSYIKAERMVEHGDIKSAIPILEKMLEEISETDRLYGQTAYLLANAYKRNGDINNYAVNLSKAAASNIQNNIRDGRALSDLAIWLYEQQEFDLAFSYINYALEEAYKSNSRDKMLAISKWMPQIGEAYRTHIARSRRNMIFWIITASILTIILATLVIFINKSRKEGKRFQQKLMVNSRLKDSYIGNFIGLCSFYSDKYQSFVKMVDRKISSGQTADLLKAIKSGKGFEWENSEFYKDIDSVVLTLYPDFIKKINTLLKPEARIIPPEGELTPELRIYAFILLGVDDSNRIARILNYSVNTVYSYRNKMRNRAINRSTFDEDVNKIGK